MHARSTGGLSQADYCAIEDALLRSTKGQDFLLEYLKRHRGGESLRLLRSISRLHRAALGSSGMGQRIMGDLATVSQTLTRVRTRAAACPGVNARAEVLEAGLDDVEATVLVLMETLEDQPRALKQIGAYPEIHENLCPGPHFGI